MGLESGAVLQVEKEGGKIILQPVQSEPQIIDKKGILVFVGTTAGDL